AACCDDREEACVHAGEEHRLSVGTEVVVEGAVDEDPGEVYERVLGAQPSSAIASAACSIRASRSSRRLSPSSVRRGVEPVALARGATTSSRPRPSRSTRKSCWSRRYPGGSASSTSTGTITVPPLLQERLSTSLNSNRLQADWSGPTSTTQTSDR